MSKIQEKHIEKNINIKDIKIKKILQRGCAGQRAQQRQSAVKIGAPPPSCMLGASTSRKKGGERNEAAERHKVGAKWAKREGRPFDATVPRPFVLAAQVLSAK